MDLLTVHPTNGRYFTDDGARALLLSGSSSWYVVIGISHSTFPPVQKDYEAFLDSLAALGHTFTRLWHTDYFKYNAPNPIEWYGPLPYARTGPGTAVDGEDKFDLDSYDASFFTRLRDVIQYADTKGIYCSVMLFEGVDAQNVGASWNVEGHAYAAANNINGITGESGDSMISCYTLSQPTGVAALQEAYVEHFLDQIEDLPNVIVEIANEADNTTATDNWQDYWVDKIQTYELANSTYQHPVLRSTSGSSRNDQTVVLATAAEMVAPSRGWTGYAVRGTPATDGSRVILLDTDHSGGTGVPGDTTLPDHVWRAFVRGHNFAYLDDYYHRKDGTSGDSGGTNPNLQTRAACGHIAYYSRRVNLVTCVPNGALASTGYCLATPGTEYLVYEDSTSAFTVNLSTGGASGVPFKVEWFNIDTGAVIQKREVMGGSATQSFTPPFTSSPSGVVLLLTVATRPETIGNRYARGWR